jgi:uncharacterized protein (TIGR00730 family)
MASREIAHDRLTNLIMVESMQERKLRMHELSDGVITLPGGFGTFEELFEMVTWGQLGLHKKPIGILNFKGYYNHLIAMVKHMAAEGLLKQRNADMLLVHDTPDGLLGLMEQYTPPEPVIKMKRDEA